MIDDILWLFTATWMIESSQLPSATQLLAMHRLVSRHPRSPRASLQLSPWLLHWHWSNPGGPGFGKLPQLFNPVTHLEACYGQPVESGRTCAYWAYALCGPGLRRSNDTIVFCSPNGFKCILKWCEFCPCSAAAFFQYLSVISLPQVNPMTRAVDVGAVAWKGKLRLLQFLAFTQSWSKQAYR